VSCAGFGQERRRTPKPEEGVKAVLTCTVTRHFALGCGHPGRGDEQRAHRGSPLNRHRVGSRAEPGLGHPDHRHAELGVHMGTEASTAYDMGSTSDSQRSTGVISPVWLRRSARSQPEAPVPPLGEIGAKAAWTRPDWIGSADPVLWQPGRRLVTSWPAGPGPAGQEAEPRRRGPSARHVRELRLCRRRPGGGEDQAWTIKPAAAPPVPW
jgi:hypothetical protein